MSSPTLEVDQALSQQKLALYTKDWKGCVSTDRKGASLTKKADATEEGRTQHVEGACGIRRGVAVTTDSRNMEKRQQKQAQFLFARGSQEGKGT